VKRVVFVRVEAERDITSARNWYEKERPGLGDEFLDAVAAAMRFLEERAELERFYFRNFRRVLLRRFPYKVFYQVIDARVVVFRVLHAKQSHERKFRN